jgi:hypothetical protein
MSAAATKPTTELNQPVFLTIATLRARNEVRA